MVLRELTCKEFLTLGGCSGLERTDFNSFCLGQGVVILEELIFKSSNFGRVCSGLEGTDL